MRENRTRYALLGALTVAPMSGYGLKRFFEQGVRFFWAESFGQIYPILRQLEAERLVARAAKRGGGDKPAGGHPRRTVYEITAAGRAALAGWLAEPAEPEGGARLEILLKLFFARQAAPDVSVRLVAAFRMHHEAMLATYAATEAGLKSAHADHPDLPYWLAALSYGQHTSRALITWCDETASALSDKELGATRRRRKKSRIER